MTYILFTRSHIIIQLICCWTYTRAHVHVLLASPNTHTQAYVLGGAGPIHGNPDAAYLADMWQFDMYVFLGVYYSTVNII